MIKTGFLLIILALVGCTAHQPSASAQKHQFIDSEKPLHQGKANKFVEAKLGFAKSSGETIRLQALVNSSVDMPQGQIEWKVPEGTVVVSGSLEGSVNFKAGNEEVFVLELEKASLKAGDKIFFFAFQMKDGERYGSPAMIVYGQSDEEKVFTKSSTNKFKGKKIFQ